MFSSRVVRNSEIDKLSSFVYQKSFCVQLDKSAQGQMVE